MIPPIQKPSCGCTAPMAMQCLHTVGAREGTLWPLVHI